MWVLAQPGESFPPQGLDLYNSADGIHWSQVWNNGPTRYEYLPTVWEFGGKLWMYVDDGKFARTGYVFRSDDGSDWKLVTDKPPFGSQSNATVSVFNGRMFFFSNRSYTNGELGAVWSSVDGSNWVPETRSYSQGYYHTASFVLGNRLFGLAQSFQPYRFASFSSGDGEEWIPAGGETEGELTAQVGVLHGGRVLLIGGWVSGTGLNFWESRDGSHWKKAGSLPAGVGGRPFAVEFQGNVWLFGQNAPGNSPGYTKIGAWRSR
jgi:hypothetical protein